jgi:phosphate transport system substrate-binding protein
LLQLDITTENALKFLPDREYKTMTSSTISIFFCRALLLMLVLPSICKAGDIIRINGSGSALDLMKPIASAYQTNNRGVIIVMERPLGSSGAIKALLGNAIDLALSSKPLKLEEKSKGARQQLYGKTPLVLIAEKNITKKDITTRELEDIYNGRTTNWPGGGNIRLILRPGEDIDSRILSDLSPGMQIAMQAAQTRPGMFTAVTDPDAYLTVQKTPGALGASGLTSIITEKLQVVSLSLNNVRPSVANLGKGLYPLAKEIRIITTAKTSPAAQRLIKFMLSTQGLAIAREHGVLVTAGTANSR